MVEFGEIKIESKAEIRRNEMLKIKMNRELLNQFKRSLPVLS